MPWVRRRGIAMRASICHKTERAFKGVPASHISGGGTGWGVPGMSSSLEVKVLCPCQTEAKG